MTRIEVMASMELPILSLSNKPDHRTRRYEHGEVFIEIASSAQGLATVHDRDIQIYCISQGAQPEEAMLRRNEKHRFAS